MGKGRRRAVEKGVLGQKASAAPHSCVSQAPVYYPTEEEFEDPLQFISKIRPEAELFGICRIVPPKSWKPPFALDLTSFTFPTKTQAIHQLQARPPSCDPDTFELEYGRFLEGSGGKRPRKRVVFEEEELDLCRLYNAVKRFGGYDKVCVAKKWGDVFRFVRSLSGKVPECSKHVLCQLYREHLYDYEEYQRQLERRSQKCKTGRVCDEKKRVEVPNQKRRRKKSSGVERVKTMVEDELDQICEQCRSGLHGEVMLLCDRCDKGWHLHCLSPPMEHVPAGNWYCLECVISDKDSFGFVPGKQYSLEAFRRFNDRTRRKLFGSAGATYSQMEKRFWEIVEGKAGELEVIYGSDLDTSLHGSGFPRAGDQIPSSAEADLWNKYMSSPWNLNNLPKLQGSLLRVVQDNIAGVMVPWLYVGMLFSSFCWHIEDHCFYSMNYLHWGEPKCWYGVPGGKGHAFEQVMRSTLPDLFDVQPDLLFQLVTMLNPSVLLDNGVQVYGVLQEPGNFVITFPRSFHGGFNFGLNCAEAVNFAPADWLPHGGFGAAQYKLYHKPAVLCHEELLYVVAKTGFDANVSPYLMEELQKMFVKEKTHRQMLWKSGIVKSSLMPPRKHPEHMGTEEDPTCIICQQYLYLSAVACSCRPSAFVCLEHWKLLCECNSRKQCLLYRHSVAELYDLVNMGSILPIVAKNFERQRFDGECQSSDTCSTELVKKVNDCDATHAELAECWLQNSSHILQVPFSDAACTSARKEAEQFLWADHDMDPVRNMVSMLIKAQKWALDLKTCLAKIDNWLHAHANNAAKVRLSEVNDVLNFNPLPCNHPEYFKLKTYAEDANTLNGVLEGALSSSSDITIDDLEELYSRTIKLPIHLGGSEKLANKLSSTKLWVDGFQRCILERTSGAIELDTLYKFKKEMMELHVQLPEVNLLSEILREAESWEVRCQEILARPLQMKELENFLDSTDIVNISCPNLMLLRQYQYDAYSWISHVHDSLKNLSGREDHNNIVMELTSILKSGKALKVQVDELHIVEVELKKAFCRKKASEVLSVQVPLETIQKVMVEARSLSIEDEDIFLKLSDMLGIAIAWEEKAMFILRHVASMSDFEDLIRISESLPVILPSLHDVQDAFSFASMWIRRCQPYLLSHVSSACTSDNLLKIEDLEELIAQSKLLKVNLETPERLHCLLKSAQCWEEQATFLVDESLTLLCMHSTDIRIHSGLFSRFEELLARVDSAVGVGVLMGFDFHNLPKLKDISLTMKWILEVLSLCFRIPLLKDVDCLIEDSKQLPVFFTEKIFVRTLTNGTRRLKKALMLFPEPQILPRCTLKDVEEILGEIQKIEIKFPLVAAKLQLAIKQHECWLEKSHKFFSAKSSENSWSSLLELKEIADSDALGSPELDKVLLETEKVENWIMRCHEIVKPSCGDIGSLVNILTKIKQSMDRALCLYNSSKGCRANSFCVCCPNYSGNEDAFTCLTCEDRYHFSCVGPPLATAGMTNEYACSYCLCMETGTISRNGGMPLILKGKRPELKLFLDLLADGEEFYSGVQERDLVKEIAYKAAECRLYLDRIVSDTYTLFLKDLSFVSESLLTALKAVAVAGVYDHQDGYNLESALRRHSWKIKVKKILNDPKKPGFHQIQRVIKEGLAMEITMKDYYMHELTYMRQISLQWADLARKTATDSGALELKAVFEVIDEGENLPVHMEKEMKLLRDRSTLYCICRKPYDRRPMIACDQCDEWYHFDCIDLQTPPLKSFFCPACKPLNGESISLPSAVQDEDRCTDGEPQTPPPRQNEFKRACSRKGRSLQHMITQVVPDMKLLSCSSEIDYLWRENRRCFRRKAKRRRHFESLQFSDSQL